MRKIYSFAFAMFMASVFSTSAVAQTTKYVKVQEEPADWSGTYLIVYEDDDNNQALIFDGSLEDLDVKNNYFSASNDYQTINNESVRTIDATDKINAAVFTISPSETEGCYYIVSASDCGIGYNSFDEDENGNPIEEPDLKCKKGKRYDNTIAKQEGKTNIIITAKVGYELRFNSDEGKTRFRYHEKGKKKAIKLYRQELVDDNGTIITTGINTVNTDSENAIYNLQGVKLAKAQKGINIINGNKVVIK